jgi:hypothetical protein
MMNDSAASEIRPTPFSGRETWSTFIRMFEEIAQYNRWNLETCALWFKLSMTGDAARFLDYIHTL